MTVLRRTPDGIVADQTAGGDLTSAYHGLTVTLLGDDGSMLRGVLTGHALANRPGHTALTIQALGTSVRIVVPHAAPVHVHRLEQR